MVYPGTYKTAAHTRINDGTSSDLSQVVATRPGWLLGVQAFNVSSVGIGRLFLFDTTAAITTTSVPFWQGPIPYGAAGEATHVAIGAGFIMDLSNRIALNNGLAYAVSSGATVAALSTMPASMITVNLQYQTSSCL